MKPAEKRTAAPHFHRETAAHAPSRNRTENLLIKSQTRRETHADSRATTEDGGGADDPDPDSHSRLVARPSHDRPHDARRRAVEIVCRREGHPLTGWNLMVSSGRRRCRTCHYATVRAQRAEVKCPPRYRELPDDTPVLRRCADCLGVYRDALGSDGGCPHCQRTLDLGGAA